MTPRGTAKRVTRPEYAASRWTPEFAAAATTELRRLDPVLGSAIGAIGPCALTPEPRFFPLLVRIIVSQQISVKAARSVGERLRRLSGGRLTAAALSRLTVDELRSAGLPRARAASIKNLADAVASRRVRLAGLADATDAEIAALLTPLHGIGRWTVEMLLIFGLGRPDVFPENDLGVRKAIGDLYGHGPLPSPSVCRKVAETWRPYRSIATWYLWRHADRNGATLGLAKYPV
ncbi:MAG TPA: DNA-3-methyladenine glycosylase 2 family protein [Planctomycetaceae bacterium]